MDDDLIGASNAGACQIQRNYIGTDVTGMNEPSTYGGDSDIYIWNGSNNLIDGNG